MGTDSNFAIRDAMAGDIDAITALVLTHGPNEWNHLPEDEVTAHIADIATRRTLAVVADMHNRIIGVTTFAVVHRYPQYQPPERRMESHGYIAEAVVDREHTGQGIGTQLCTAAIERLAELGMQEVYAMCHADNRPSARMMERAGMEQVAVFDDPQIRLTGSRKTAVSRIVLPERQEPL